MKARQEPLPGASAGIGLRSPHFRDVVASGPEVGFFEVHAENFMGAGGPPHRYLAAVRGQYPLSVHGVGLSIASAGPLDQGHLARLRTLLERYEPVLFSEHLAWSTLGGVFFDDLLPIPYTMESLRRVADHVDEVQESLGRQILLENPSTYLGFEESCLSEPQFIGEVVRRTGCGLLLDVGNVHVACTNNGWDPEAYLDAYPLDEVREIHLAGFDTEIEPSGRSLLIDTHDREVAPAVWDLYGRVLAETGPIPTLIERDQALPDLARLVAEANMASRVMSQFAREAEHARAG